MVVRFPKILAAGLILLAFASPSPAVEEFISVEGKRVGITLVPEKPVIMLGEPGALIFTVNNLSDAPLYLEVGGDYRNRLGRPDSFKVSVKGAYGVPVQQPESGFNMGGIGGLEEIPVKGNYSFRLFLPHWAQFEAPGTYSISVRRKLVMTSVKGPYRQRKEMIVTEVEAVTSIQIGSQDPDEMGKIIDSLGTSMISDRNSEVSESATRRLAAIQDERVIPWFARAFGLREYGLKFSALSVLAKFNQVEAFNVLKAGMDTKGVDLDGATNPELANQLADNIRHAAAVGLSRSPYPGAKAFLISQRKDTSMGVRITILHILGQMPREEALPILEEMSQDQDTRVGNEAKRYIALLTAKK
jgi:hypothetical protein